jgi:hypothetical protein
MMNPLSDWELQSSSMRFLGVFQWRLCRLCIFFHIEARVYEMETALKRVSVYAVVNCSEYDEVLEDATSKVF